MLKNEYKLIPSNAKVNNILYLNAFDVKNTFEGTFQDNVTKISNGAGGIADIFKSADISSIKSIIKATGNIKEGDSKDIYDALSTLSITKLGEVQEIFVLPLPNNISESYVHQYSETELNYMTMILDAINSKAGGKNDQGAIELAQKAVHRSGSILDPRLLDVYKSTDLRRINFGFHLLPQSAKEANMFVESLLKLKSSSRMNQESTFGNVVQMINLNRIFTTQFAIRTNGTFKKNKALNSLINTSNGFMVDEVKFQIKTENLSLYKDSMPKRIEVHISLIERTPVYSKFWKKVLENVT